MVMKIGVPKEVKENENRVALTPWGVKALIEASHQVYIEKGAGEGSGFSDQEYIKAGAVIVDTPDEIYHSCEMIVKVKEPQKSEYDLLQEGKILFTYLHLASNPELTQVLLKKGVIAIAYETVQEEDGSLPLLRPMSEIAGRLSVQIAAWLLEKHNGGRGVLLSGVPGVERGNVMILGGGVVGLNAAKIAIGMGAKVTVLDVDIKRLTYLDDIFGNAIQTRVSNYYTIEESVKEADVLIGAVLIPGYRAPKLVTEQMVKEMKNGAVIVDVAIDQGGCVETIDRVTTHENPYFIKHGVVHYCVANIPGAVPRTSTIALTNATFRYVLEIANKGYRRALLENPVLRKGLNAIDGKITHVGVAKSLGFEYTDPLMILQ